MAFFNAKAAMTARLPCLPSRSRRCGAHASGPECQFEVRNIAPSSDMSEDPIAGSRNAAIAQWKYGAGQWRDPVIVAQGTCIGRVGRLYIRRDDKTGIVWVGGQTAILIEGTLTL
jgi:predicted PhzF superfamily epimerase YddE/YHI9